MSTEADAHPRTNLRLAIAIGAAAIAVGLLLLGPMRRLIGPAPPRATALRLFAAGQYEKSRPFLAQCLAYDPSDAEVRLAMAEVALRRGDSSPEACARNALGLLEGVRFPGAGSQAAALVIEGKAHEMLHEAGKAEDAYSLALRTDPNVGEAGWLLIQTYYVQGRLDEMRRLALRLARTEPDPRDKVRLLLEPCRPDALPLSDAGVVASLEPAHRADPDDLRLNLAYYRALAGDGSKIDVALTGLRGLLAKHPAELAAWEALLEALGTTGQLDELATTLGRVPPKLAKDARILRQRGRLALEQGDFATAIKDLQAAVAARPYDVKSLHRLATALKRAGKVEEAKDVQRREDEYEQARIALRGIASSKDAEGTLGAFQKATSRPNLGLVPDPPLYRELASIRERMGHPDEAIAWHRLILEALPADAASREAVERLEKPASPPSP